MEDYSKIFTLQKKLFNSGHTKNTTCRKDYLLRLKNLLEHNEERLYEAIYKDFGKSPFDTFNTELSIIYKEIDYYLKNIGRLSKPKKVKTNLLNQPASSYIYTEPLGCVLIIGAWNYPYQLSLMPAIAALAAGNTCFIKPSEQTPNTLNLLKEIINNNFPKAYVYVIDGGVEEISEVLKLPFDKIFFTGSPKIGRVVYEAAAKNLIPVTLELGGKSPVIVTKSANLESAARRIIWGKFLNAGQTCIAPDYVLAEKSIKQHLIRLFKQNLIEFGYKEGADCYTRIINKRNFDRIKTLINPDKVCYGGETNEKHLYISPTLLDNVTWQDPVMQEEIFGPVLPIISFSDYSEEINKLSRLEKPLAAYLFTKDESEKDLFLNKLSFGGGCINDTVMHISNENLPFGGVGNSGIGSYHGDAGFATFSHAKSILDKKGIIEPDLKYPPYNEDKFRWLKLILK